MFIKDTGKCANSLFTNAELGDKQRTKRLMKLAHQMVIHSGSSIVKASIEGAYCFLINDDIDANDIAIAGFSSLLP